MTERVIPPEKRISYLKERETAPFGLPLRQSDSCHLSLRETDTLLSVLIE
ncbi:MAG: hypothetical protein IJN88_09590 [Clostridia bacterium]|nr:hypothetical protein [Clostridia bacterium]